MGAPGIPIFPPTFRELRREKFDHARFLCGKIALRYLAHTRVAVISRIVV